MNGNRPRFRGGTAPHAESYFLRASSPDRRYGLWLNFVLLSLPGGRFGEVWMVFFDAEAGRHWVAKERYEWRACALRAAPLRLILGRSELIAQSNDRQRWSGDVRGEDGPMWFDVVLGGVEAAFEPFPPWLYEASWLRAKALTPAPSATVNGVVAIDGREIELVDWRGMQGHHWGHGYARDAVWAHSSAFDGEPASTWFEGFSAKLVVGPFTAPAATVMALSWRGERFLFNRLTRVFAAKSHRTFTGWTFVARQGEVELAGKVNAAPEQLVGLTYEDPSGGAPVYCLSGQSATMELLLTRPGVEPVSLVANGGAAFKVLTARDDHGVRMR